MPEFKILGPSIAIASDRADALAQSPSSFTSMRLYTLLAAGSCAALLVGCSRKPKSTGQVGLSSDPSLANAIASFSPGVRVTSVFSKSTGNGKATGSFFGGGAAGGGAAVLGARRSAGASSPTTGNLVPLRAVSNADVWLSATAPAGSPNDVVFIPVSRPADKSTAGPELDRRAMMIAQSAIGVGTLLSVGGVWGGEPSPSYAGFSQVIPQSFGLGFEGYHQGFSQANPTPSAPDGDSHGSPPWNPPGSQYGGGDDHPGPPGGGGGGTGPSNGNGPNQGPPDNHNDDRGGWDDRGSHGPPPPPVTATPEPGTVVLLATGFLALVPVVRRRRRA